MSEEATLDEFTDTEPSESRRETPIGELPADWNVDWLEDVTKINPDGFSEDDWPSETFQYISLSEVSEGNIIRSQTVPLDEAPSRAQRRVQKDDVLVGTVRPKQVSHGVVTPEHDGKICSSGFGVLRAGANLNPYYLIQQVLSHRFFSQMEAYVAGSGYPAVKISDLKKHRVSVPPLPEQRKIATVLYTVDRAIEKTKEVIEQTERTQKGLIRHLFRKGVSDEATEAHGVLGKMPTSWQITELSNIADVVMGSSPKSEYYNESGDGLPFYQGNNDFNRRNPTTNVWCTDPVKQAKKGDILISIRAPVGDLNIATEDCCIGRGLAAIRPQSIDFDYLYYHLYERNNWFKRISSGSTFDSINSSQISNTKIKFPEENNQEKIGGILKNNELYILKEEEYLNQLQRLKRGLMQDLLSGTVRTTDTNIEVPDEIAQYG
jgi:type I restriction enzyme S subunit